jgi:hypothetical protein
MQVPQQKTVAGECTAGDLAAVFPDIKETCDYDMECAQRVRMPKESKRCLHIVIFVSFITVTCLAFATAFLCFSPVLILLDRKSRRPPPLPSARVASPASPRQGASGPFYSASGRPPRVVVHTHTRIHTHTHTHTHAHIHAHTHTHTQESPGSVVPPCSTTLRRPWRPCVGSSL